MERTLLFAVVLAARARVGWGTPAEQALAGDAGTCEESRVLGARAGLPLLACFALACVSGTARADDRPVIVLLGGSAELVGQLRVQLIDQATVVVAPPISEGELGQSLRSADRAREAAGADVAVWVTVESRSRAHVLHVAGRRADSAFVRSWRAPGLDGPERDRAMAIILGEILASLLEQGSETLALAPAPNREDRWRLVFGLAGAGVWLEGPNMGQGGIRLRGGVRWEDPSVLVECLVGLGWASAIGVETPLGDVEVSEADLRGKLSALAWVDSRLALGGSVEVIGRFAEARGVAPDGRRGSAMAPTFSVGAAFEARLRVADAIDLQAGLGAEVSPTLERYSIDSREVLALGRFRLQAEVGILVAFP
jgi:hypothetical protein